MRRRLGNFLLFASVLIAGGWIWFAVERLGAGLDEWERVFVVAGFIVLVGLALRTFLLATRKTRLSDLKVSRTALCLGPYQWRVSTATVERNSGSLATLAAMFSVQMFSRYFRPTARRIVPSLMSAW